MHSFVRFSNLEITFNNKVIPRISCVPWEWGRQIQNNKQIKCSLQFPISYCVHCSVHNWVWWGYCTNVVSLVKYHLMGRAGGKVQFINLDYIDNISSTAEEFD